MFDKSHIKLAIWVLCPDAPLISLITETYVHVSGDRSSTVKALCYKSEGRWFDPSDSIMALESTQPLTVLSTRRISWG